jgi:hypothetical protein
MRTSGSGRNPGFGRPPKMGHKPRDQPPVIFVLWPVLVKEFALLKRREDLIHQDVPKCQQKIAGAQENDAQDHQLGGGIEP